MFAVKYLCSSLRVCVLYHIFMFSHVHIFYIIHVCSVHAKVVNETPFYSLSHIGVCCKGYVKNVKCHV